MVATETPTFRPAKKYGRAQQGLGYLMIQSNARLKTDWVFAAIFYLALMGLGLWWLVGKLERRLAAWRYLAS